MYTLNLVDGWSIHSDPENLGLDQQWHRSPPPEGNLSARVPGAAQETLPGHHGVMWYWCDIECNLISEAAQYARLAFGAVDYATKVWLNGTLVGEHEGGETPFDLDVTNALDRDGVNLLALRVLNPTTYPIEGLTLDTTPHGAKAEPYTVGCGYNVGGITQLVELRFLTTLQIQDVYTETNIDRGTAKVTLLVSNLGNEELSARVQLSLRAGPTADSSLIDNLDIAAAVPPGDSRIECKLVISQPRLWQPDDPFMYYVHAQLENANGHGHPISTQFGARFGFRDFRVGEDGYFRLNGVRIFLRCVHTIGHYPIGQTVPHGADVMRRDIINTKAAGFNCIRFIAGMAYPEQLDLCDELGLMVYEESRIHFGGSGRNGLLLSTSPQIERQFDDAIAGMITRDRRHPSIVIWGVLNETLDGPIFRHAVSALPTMRALDSTRLILLNSGRWDGDLSVGSVSNPGDATWSHLWGREATRADRLDWNDGRSTVEWARHRWFLRDRPGGYVTGAGDAHLYPRVPHDSHTRDMIRRLGTDSRPVFLSEYGTGSQVNAIRLIKQFEQAGANEQLEDARLYTSIAKRFLTDWSDFAMAETYPFPEDFLEHSQELNAKWRRQGFDLICSNAEIVGYNLTAAIDGGATGEGLWSLWREFKTGMFDALAEGTAPLRWCLFVEPTHVYAGRPFTVQAVLANDGVLPPGTYPVRFRIFGPGGVAWEKDCQCIIPKDPPFAIPVLSTTVVIQGQEEGDFCLTASMDRGGAPRSSRRNFYVSVPITQFSAIQWTIASVALDDATEEYIRRMGVDLQSPWRGERRHDVLLVGDTSRVPFGEQEWRDLTHLIQAGSTAVFLDPRAFREGHDSTRWLPLERRGEVTEFRNWLFHRDDVAKQHSIFADLPSGCIMDWEFYDQIVPDFVLEDAQLPDEVVAASFALGYPAKGGYASGVVCGVYRIGSGAFIFNSFRVIENLDANPAADRLMGNITRFAGSLATNRHR